MTISDNVSNRCNNASCKLFTLVDESFIDKYALLSVMVIKISRIVPCCITISDGWVYLYAIKDTDLTIFSYIMDRYIYVFHE